MDDLGKAFTFPFEDKDWLQKILIAGLIGIVPILNFALLGYVLELIADVSAGRPARLPQWDNLGEKWKKGLFVTLAGFIYALPALVIFCCAYAPMFVSGFDTSGSSDWALVSLPLICLAYLVLFVYEVALLLLVPFLGGMYVRSGEFGALFRVRDAFEMFRRNMGDALIVFLLAVLAGMVASFGFYLCFVPGLFTLPYGYAVIGHLFGQLYGKATRGEEPTPAV